MRKKKIEIQIPILLRVHSTRVGNERSELTAHTPKQCCLTPSKEDWTLWMFTDVPHSCRDLTGTLTSPACTQNSVVFFVNFQLCIQKFLKTHIPPVYRSLIRFYSRALKVILCYLDTRRRFYSNLTQTDQFKSDISSFLSQTKATLIRELRSQAKIFTLNCKPNT